MRMERIIDITSDGLYLSTQRGFLTVNEGQNERGRVALDDIGAVIAHAHGLTWSNNLFVKLAERNVPVVLCAANHAPVTCLWPLQGHHRQAARMRTQAQASKPLKKRLWQQIVVAKITMQMAILLSVGKKAKALERLASTVRSGDPDNVEAQAARYYWPLLMGRSFRRDIKAEGTNAMLNYGYTVLRAVVLRAICGAGLHPTLGLHHENQANAFALADDLMEPYRPLVDRTVYNLIKQGLVDIDSDVKAALAALSTFDLETDEGMSPLTVHASRLAHSLATSFDQAAPALRLPTSPGPDALAQLGRKDLE